MKKTPSLDEAFLFIDEWFLFEVEPFSYVRLLTYSSRLLRRTLRAVYAAVVYHHPRSDSHLS